MNKVFNIILFIALLFCSNLAFAVENGADQTPLYLNKLEGKRVGIVVNQTSVVGAQHTHLLDTLIASNIKVAKIFTPEHGFRGDGDAGEQIKGGVDVKSGVQIVSLYGSNKKPTEAQLKDIDILVFDIQDVGVRFYTYISTLYYVMQSCSLYDVELMVLDRPNPNDYIDGPVMTPELKSFVGALPIPILHGMTMGELAKMINGEGWELDNYVDLTVVPIKGWQHGDSYSLPIKPSPNLPNDQSIALYPSLCFFEATNVSVGRGTYTPFQVIGYPDSKFGEFSFTPEPLVGFDKNPLQNGKECFGLDLRETQAPKGLSLSYFINFMKISEQGAKFISRPQFFDMLMGNSVVRKMLCEGRSEEKIKASWSEELEQYKIMREQYLIYNDYKE